MKNNIIIIVFIFSTLSCKSESETKETPKINEFETIISNSKFKNLPIETAFISQNEFESEIISNGTVDVPPDKVYDVSFPLSGTISDITHNLLPGSAVKTGEKLARIRSLELLQIEEDYLTEKTKNEFLRQENERQQNLLNADAGAKKKWQETDNNLKLNILRIKSLSEKLNAIGINSSKLSLATISPYFTLKAKSNSFVKNVNVTNGKNFMSADPLFSLINTDHMHVELKVFGNDINSIKVGQIVEFKNENNQPIFGKVHLIDKIIDPETKSLNLHVHIDNQAFERTLHPGQYISGKIKMRKFKANSVPESAVLISESGNFVFAIKNEGNENMKIIKTPVKIGKLMGSYYELLSPSIFIEKIITKGVNYVENINNLEE